MLGNPPYVRQEQLAPNKPYFQTAFTVYHGMTDLYAYFYERDVRLLRQGGWLGLITSNKFLRASYGEPLRRVLARATQLQGMIGCGRRRLAQTSSLICRWPVRFAPPERLASFAAERSFRSGPGQKAPPAPVRTPTRTSRRQ